MTSWPPTLPVRHVRIARPTDQLGEVARFYREGLGLPEIGRFDAHAGYRGVLLGLPGPPYHLEFTQHDQGSPGPAPSRDNLLVLYLDNLAHAEQVAGRLAALGHPRVEAENPYWTGNGAITVEDPDHWRIVLMPQPFADGPEPAGTVAWYAGDREALRPLFELAEDSAAELDSYLHTGRILIARSGPQILGHLQLTGTGQPRQAEVKNMAVREELQGQGLGRRLMQAAFALLAAEEVTTVLVATAAADIGNLRFYQRLGFRMRSVERDVFTESAGYPPGTQVDGITLRDRVWLDIQLGPALCEGLYSTLGGGRELALTIREFDLLAFFLSHPGQAFTWAQLLDQVWGWSYGDLSTVTVCVRRIREKAEDDPAAPAHLQTVWGVGYRWETEPPVSSCRGPVRHVPGLVGAWLPSLAARRARSTVSAITWGSWVAWRGSSGQVSTMLAAQRAQSRTSR